MFKMFLADKGSWWALKAAEQLSTTTSQSILQSIFECTYTFYNSYKTGKIQHALPAVPNTIQVSTQRKWPLTEDL